MLPDREDDPSQAGVNSPDAAQQSRRSTSKQQQHQCRLEHFPHEHPRLEQPGEGNTATPSAIAGAQSYSDSLSRFTSGLDQPVQPCRSGEFLSAATGVEPPDAPTKLSAQRYRPLPEKPASVMSLELPDFY